MTNALFTKASLCRYERYVSSPHGHWSISETTFLAVRILTAAYTHGVPNANRVSLRCWASYRGRIMAHALPSAYDPLALVRGEGLLEREVHAEHRWAHPASRPPAFSQCGSVTVIPSCLFSYFLIFYSLPFDLCLRLRDR